MSGLVSPFVQWLEQKGHPVLLRHEVQSVSRSSKGYKLQVKHKSEQRQFEAKKVVFAIPLNNVLELADASLQPRFSGKVMESEQLNSAFQMGLAFTPERSYDSLHHQIHTPNGLPFTGSKSFFLSLSHEQDTTRAPEQGQRVASVSMHVPHPEQTLIGEKEQLEQAVIAHLQKHRLLQPDELHFMHSSTPGSWHKWTARKWGFVGGYPQYRNIKPWQLPDARLSRKGAYICGDSVYPGQGIPGAALSGIIAAEKLLADK